MRMTLRSFLLSLSLVAVGASGSLVASGCATSSGATAPSGPVELNGTKWRLTASAGKLDGRIIEFKKVGEGYVGTMVKKARYMLEMAGIPDNMEAFKLRPTSSPNDYTGVYVTYGIDGSRQEREVNVSVSGDVLNWNLESATWERVTD